MTTRIAIFACAALAAAQVAGAQAQAAGSSLDTILKQVSTYGGGIESAALWQLRDYVYARKDDRAGRAECEAKLLQFLKTPATPVAKMAACKYLRVIAGDSAIPALQAMLADPRSADMAIYVLQQMPGAAVDRALVQALAATREAARTAVIVAIGERRIADAVPALLPLMKQPASRDVAATALGRIGGPDAAAGLAASYGGAPPEFKRVLAASMLATAEGLLIAKQPDAALRLYDTLSSDGSLPASTRRGAFMGKVRASSGGGTKLVLEMLGGTDPIAREAAIACIAEVIPPDAIDSVCAMLPRLSGREQVQVLAVLSGYPADRVLPAVLQAAHSEDGPTRLAATKALGSVGGVSVVPLLAETAARTKGPEQAASRAALGMLRGHAVDEAVTALLAQGPSERVRGELILAIAERRIYSAKTLVAASLASPSTDVRTQALKALRTIGAPSDVPALLDLLLKTTDDADRIEAEKTIAALLQMTESADGRSRSIRARLAKEKSADARVRLINVLALIGDNSSLPAIRTALVDSSPDVVDAAVRALAAWPTSATREDLMRLQIDQGNETHRLLTIGGLVRSIGLDPYRNPEAAVADLKAAADQAWRPEERKLILGALVSFPCKDALDLATAFLKYPEVREEAQAAVDRLTARLAKDAGR